MEAGKKSKIIGGLIIITLLCIIITVRVLEGRHKSRSYFILLGVCIVSIVGTLLWVYFQHGSARRMLEHRSILENSSQQLVRVEYSFLRKVAGVPLKFHYKDLEEATDNFEALIGRGASASVFKGLLEDGTEIAVKRIERGFEQGDKEFLSEVAAIGSVHHVNLVRLLGYSSVPGSGSPRLLVYEYIHNKALSDWIFPNPSKRNPKLLPWEVRYRVAIDVAKGLAYLHHDCRSRIVHLDVKPENILLDYNFRALVADFGLAKLMGKDESRIYTTLRGTRGYLAPEWLLQNGISEKSDIYSYGMVLFEIIGGRRNVQLQGQGKNSQWSYFPKTVVEKLKQGKLMEIVDPRLLTSEEGGSVDENELKTLVYVALWCVQEEHQLRPTMARVVDMLESRIKVETPPDTEMIIIDLLCIDQDETPTVVAHQMETGVPPQSGACSFAFTCISGR
ncbi:hypothetical protein MKW98_007511 [Papaver atlanticum]|uniref:Protein kinase domain-containing protein n=1 Tax=Papaver atlanticum TaxID=357466 RepID=A0AAD4XCY5_9MAGN|nr:hypothetical protein MKW98_007511 [Papaver atlanticum]